MHTLHLKQFIFDFLQLNCKTVYHYLVTVHPVSIDDCMLCANVCCLPDVKLATEGRGRPPGSKPEDEREMSPTW